MNIRPIRIPAAFSSRDFWSLEYTDARGVVTVGGDFPTRKRALDHARNAARHYRGVTVSA